MVLTDKHCWPTFFQCCCVSRKYLYRCASLFVTEAHTHVRKRSESFDIPVFKLLKDRVRIYKAILIKLSIAVQKYLYYVVRMETFRMAVGTLTVFIRNLLLHRLSGQPNRPGLAPWTESRSSGPLFQLSGRSWKRRVPLSGHLKSVWIMLCAAGHHD